MRKFYDKYGGAPAKCKLTDAAEMDDILFRHARTVVSNAIHESAVCALDWLIALQVSLSVCLYVWLAG